MNDEQLNEVLALETARGIIETGIEGAYNSVTCSTAGDYPSLGCSQWEGQRANELLSWLDNGRKFINRSYSDIARSSEMPELKAMLASEQSKAAQQEILKIDCKRYIEAVRSVPSMDDTRCVIYAAMWCPTSDYVVKKFLQKRWITYDLRSLKGMRDLFASRYYLAAGVGERYAKGYENRANITFEYVASLDLTTKYGVPSYGAGPFGY